MRSRLLVHAVALALVAACAAPGQADFPGALCDLGRKYHPSTGELSRPGADLRGTRGRGPTTVPSSERETP